MKDVVIKIVGTQNYGQDDKDSIELVTDGKYAFSEGRGEVFYTESELTGMEGTNTHLTISPLEVVLRREGSVTSSTVFREGQRNAFLYDTPYGKATMGVDTRKIAANFDEHGGSMEIDYVVDMDHAVFGRNKFQMHVREQERQTI
ncbi:MAG TPA: DUF1934 domain-containing protein [Oscillospiraceae bacterium]|nr:DUF1934 domain-containing protein [Oscillospiraceae bacterium]HNX99709.1 DUF1934 domain-containing protein [Oscillospiraceae bacterium]HPS75472.1 DUF1934 domain-containing protein [Oscillospiraceae bacterium]